MKLAQNVKMILLYIFINPVNIIEACRVFLLARYTHYFVLTKTISR